MKTPALIDFRAVSQSDATDSLRLYRSQGHAGTSRFVMIPQYTHGCSISPGTVDRA